ncbi:hypothetical protein HOD29_05095 [archaeon]|jgi:hypothetical protein|nr:hypothetical protein [archaeon]
MAQKKNFNPDYSEEDFGREQFMFMVGNVGHEMRVEQKVTENISVVKSRTNGRYYVTQFDTVAMMPIAFEDISHEDIEIAVKRAKEISTFDQSHGDNSYYEDLLMGEMEKEMEREVFASDEETEEDIRVRNEHDEIHCNPYCDEVRIMF